MVVKNGDDVSERVIRQPHHLFDLIENSLHEMVDEEGSKSSGKRKIREDGFLNSKM